ncbi:hypothetical protein OEZ86_002618 [Tetradesmus obliquus]|nr:hypothetical protein OEZ86_002618 [Tetradesmus obliquus]
MAEDLNADVEASLQQYRLLSECAWRSRGPRLAFNRYISVRQRHAAASLWPAFSSWWHWTLARRHHKQAVQRQAFQAWRELVQLQLVLCSKLVRALQRGVLAGDTAGLLMWRLCTPVDEQHRTAVHPSMGRLLASILQRKEPQRRLQGALSALLEHCRALQAVRARVHARLSAACLRWRKASLLECLRFWRMHAVARCCERLSIALPMFQPRSLQFETWLWQHERRRQLKQQAAALFQRMCLQRCFVGWQAHGFKACLCALL